jgi:phospholipid-binding lipoprotein MlaA
LRGLGAAARPSWLWLLALALVAHAPPAHTETPTAPAVPKAAAPAPDLLTPEDPFEKTNRWFYRSYRSSDRSLMRPLALGYARYTPQPLQMGLRNVLTEVREPQVFANDMVQFRFKAAAKTLARFVVNATVGIAGLTDPAAKWGLPHENNGFGDTLGRLGMRPGPYVFLPWFGPSDFRDMIGKAVDLLTDPVGWGHYENDEWVRGGVWFIGGLDQRAQAEDDLERIDMMGTDSYATMRSYFLQSRQAEINEGAQVKIEELPSFDEEPAPPPAAAPAQPAPATPPAAPSATAAPAAAPASALTTEPEPVMRSSGDVEAFLAPPAQAPPPVGGPPIEL